MAKKPRFKKGTNDADSNGVKGGSLPADSTPPAGPVVKEQFMSTGNTPAAVAGGEFPVLVLDDGSRIVGNKGQTFEALANQARERGQVA